VFAADDPRDCFNTRSVGPRASESAEGKEAELAYHLSRIVDAGRRSHSALAADRSQDGVLKQSLKAEVAATVASRYVGT